MAGYVYSDQQMMLATQLAYLGNDGDSIEGESAGCVIDTYMRYVKTDSNGNPVRNSDGFFELDDAFKNDSNASEMQKRLEVVTNIQDLTKDNPNLDNWQNWVIKDVCNENTSGSGYVGMLIDTGDGNAIIANRGSESYNGQQTALDWGVSDVGIAGSVLTAQQAASERYLKELWEKYGDQYDSFSLTGHSLGGNLAEHQTITAPPGMLEKINHTISFDGPGFSDEYIKLHWNEIMAIGASGIMIHYQWSWVSSLLLPLPNIKDQPISANNDPTHSGLLAYLFRHDTKNVNFNDDGSIIPVDMDAYRVVIEVLTGILELLPPEWTQKFFAGLQAIVIGIGLIQEAIREFKEAVNTIKTWVKDMYYKYIAPQVSGIYEVNISAVNGCANDILNEIRYLEGIRDDISSLVKSLKYFSGGGGAFKSVFWGELVVVDKQIWDLKRLAGKLTDYADRYKSVDGKVAGYFNGLPKTI